MNKNIYDDFTASYYNCSSLFSFNDKEILDYFESMVNNDLLINEKYNLIVTSEKENSKKYLTYDATTKTFFFNRRIFQTLFYIENKDSSNIIFACNHAILEIIHTIISKIELERKIKSKSFYKNNPIFYRCYLQESVSGYKNELKENFIIAKNTQLLNNFYNICIKEFGLDECLKNELNDWLRNYLLNYENNGILDTIDSYQNLADIFCINLIDYEKEIQHKYDIETLEKYNYSTLQKKSNKRSLLDSMLYSKKFTKHEKEFINDKNINILDYANNEVINNMNIKLALKR